VGERNLARRVPELEWLVRAGRPSCAPPAAELAASLKK